MVIRPAERRDLDAMLALWDALQADGTAADPRYATAPGGREAMRTGPAALWTCTDPFPGAFVAEDGGALCGYVTGTLAQNHPVLVPRAQVRIDNLYVAPRARRQGLGRRLVGAFVGAAEAAGYRGVDVGTLARDTRAVAFWQALGFSPMRVVLNRATLADT